MKTEQLSQEGLIISLFLFYFGPSLWNTGEHSFNTVTVGGFHLSCLKELHNLLRISDYASALCTLKIIPLSLLLFENFCCFVSTDAIESLRQNCEFVCPNDGFLDQVK